MAARLRKRLKLLKQSNNKNVGVKQIFKNTKYGKQNKGNSSYK